MRFLNYFFFFACIVASLYYDYQKQYDHATFELILGFLNLYAAERQDVL